MLDKRALLHLGGYYRLRVVQPRLADGHHFRMCPKPPQSSHGLRCDLRGLMGMDPYRCE